MDDEATAQATANSAHIGNSSSDDCERTVTNQPGGPRRGQDDRVQALSSSTAALSLHEPKGEDVLLPPATEVAGAATAAEAGPSACTRALAMPEILAEILSWVAADTTWSSCASDDTDTGAGAGSGEDTGSEDDDVEEKEEEEPYGTPGVLARCARVNSLWFSLSVAHLWEDMAFVTWPLGGGLSGMTRCLYLVPDAERRRAYARCVRWAYVGGLVPLPSSPSPSSSSANDASPRGMKYWDTRLQAWSEDVSRAAVDEMYDGLEFPLLEELEIWMAGWRESGHPPRIRGAPRMKTLALNPSFDMYPDTYRVGQDEMGSMLEEIPRRGGRAQDIFPDLEEFSIHDACLAYPGAFDKFAKRMPKLRVFDHAAAVETMGEPASST
ncbi:hypothetical protein Micbo1qcDRAFT_234491 [Microdochium bolleyi]|uniref:F-box domain-containing protein n=1 Tax=Microdochium bolleyi TaxID=196109 RepID=A0A136J0H0_9PEZI|nr:hypothetical protein Micbo1qcDRAFT_234491 [Microdochium bolleyi]